MITAQLIFYSLYPVYSFQQVKKYIDVQCNIWRSGGNYSHLFNFRATFANIVPNNSVLIGQ